jgi:hypothetical protein
MAAPFSARPGTPLAAVVLIRHARAALGHGVQMRALLCLHGVSAAAALSALHLQGVRYGRAHLLAVNAIGSLCGWATAFPHLRPSLSRRPPLSSVLTPTLALSRSLQALLHLGTMALALAIGASEDCRLAAVGAAIGNAASAAIGGAASAEATAAGSTAAAAAVASAPLPAHFILGGPERPFAPSAVNSAVICLELAQTIAITAVSTRLAHPPRARRRALSKAFRLADLAVVCAASGLFPALSRALQLQEPASARFRAFLVALVLADRLGAAACDELAHLAFRQRWRRARGGAPGRLVSN